jgi:two-component system response regulator NreC
MPAELQIAPDPADALRGSAGRHAIRVVLADDHSAMRRGLRRLLDRERGITVVAEADDLAGAMRQVHAEHPDVLVLDLSMHNGSGIDAVRRLRERAPHTQIVVLKMEESTAFARRALDVGAVGFVLKDTADAELPEAIRCAALVQEYLSPRIASRMAPGR